MFLRGKDTCHCRQDTHSQYTSVQYSLFTSAERTSRAGLKADQAPELHCHLCAPEKSLVIRVCNMSHPWLLFHLPFTTSTSSSSFTLPSMTQEHAAQSVQLEQLREHPAHHAHLQAPSLEKLRHQESLWSEELLSGGNPRTTTPTAFPVDKEKERKATRNRAAFLVSWIPSTSILRPQVLPRRSIAEGSA